MVRFTQHNAHNRVDTIDQHSIDDQIKEDFYNQPQPAIQSPPFFGVKEQKCLIDYARENEALGSQFQKL